MCCHGGLLRSPALLFNEDRLKEELAREQTEKHSNVNATNQNSTFTRSSMDTDDHKQLVSSADTAMNSRRTNSGIDNLLSLLAIKGVGVHRKEFPF